jgi:hypothetical protein
MGKTKRRKERTHPLKTAKGAAPPLSFRCIKWLPSAAHGRPAFHGDESESGTIVLWFIGEGKGRVEVASRERREGKPQRWDLRGPKIDLQRILNEFVDEK